MPLITLCGFPCVGKTRFAEMLASNIDQKCVIVNEESLHMNKSQHYTSAANEKVLRQNLKGAVERALNADTVVILDSCNYIKGYRYEMYCIARSNRTPHCVVHVTVDNQTADNWNKGNDEGLKYDQTLIDEIRKRFEAPISSNRWDSPLFCVNMNPCPPTSMSHPDGSCVSSSDCKNDCRSSDVFAPDSAKTPIAAAAAATSSSWKSKKAKPESRNQSTSSSSAGSTLPKKSNGFSGVYFSGNQRDREFNLSSEGPDSAISKITSYLKTAEAPQPNAATNTTKHSSAILLYELDKVSQSLTQAIVSHQQRHNLGTPMVFKEYGDFSLSLPRKVSMAELQRHRRQYIKVTSQHPPENNDDMGKKYLEFLSHQC